MKDLEVFGVLDLDDIFGVGGLELLEKLENLEIEPFNGGFELDEGKKI